MPCSPHCAPGVLHRLGVAQAASGQYCGLFFDAAPHPTWVCDRSGRVVALNAEALRQYGYSRQEWLEMHLEDVAMPGETPRHRRRDGTAVEVEIAARGLEVDGCRLQVVTAVDVGLRRRMEALDRERTHAVEMIARNEEPARVLDRLAALVEVHCAGISCSIMLLRNGRLYRAAGAQRLARLVGELDGLAIDPGEEAGAGAPFWTMAPASADVAVAPRWQPYRTAALHYGVRGCWSSPILSGAGEVLGSLVAYTECAAGPPAQDLPFLHCAARLTGIAVEQGNLVADLVYQAEHDALTRLPNRRLFEDRLVQAILLADRNSRKLAVLHLDLDRFQSINDRLGRAMGDRLLESIARRLEACIRKSDTLARTGGDEFLLLLPDLESGADGAVVALKLLHALQNPFSLNGHELFVTASIGISAYPGDADGAAALERNATDALYRAKSQGRNCVQAFTADMSRATHQRLETEVHLQRALERGELTLNFQPQFDLVTGQMSGAEALLRWTNPTLGPVSPAVFIPVAEESGLIVPIGRWVLEEACRQRALWGIKMGRGRVAVNVSGVQFARPDFAEQVASALENTGLAPELLDLELTESVVMLDLEKTAHHMSVLRNLGVSISMDDFGTGYSSLSYLQRLPFQAVKIDQSFVREIRSARDRPPLVSSIIGMARALGKQVIAEGVETDEQLEALAAMGCDVGQGYLLGRPVPSECLFPPQTDGSETASLAGTGAR